MNISEDDYKKIKIASRLAEAEYNLSQIHFWLQSEGLEHRTCYKSLLGTLGYSIRDYKKELNGKKKLEDYNSKYDEFDKRNRVKP